MLLFFCSAIATPPFDPVGSGSTFAFQFLPFVLIPLRPDEHLKAHCRLSPVHTAAADALLEACYMLNTERLLNLALAHKSSSWIRNAWGESPVHLMITETVSSNEARRVS